MIRKLTDKDREIVISYLNKQPAFNLFIISDIENFGFESEFQDVWGDFSESGNVRAVLLRFYDSFLPFNEGEHDIEGFVKIIRSYTDKPALSGVTSLIEPYETALADCLGKKKVMFFCECSKNSFEQMELEKERVQIATLDEVDKIAFLQGSIEEFSDAPNPKERIAHRLESGTGRTYFIEKDDHIVAAASTTAENSVSAMIVAVCTDPRFRGEGYATQIMNVLVSDLLYEGKSLCLFYDNPTAGKIYKRLGFKDIGYWTMYR